MANSNDFVVKNGLVVSTTATILSLTNTLNTSSGALIISGGVGIGQDLRVGGTIYSPNIVGLITTATNLQGGLAGQIPYQTAPGATSFINTGTAGNILVSQGTNAPSYQNTLTLAGTTVATSTNTGALQVAGGVGIGGDLYIGGTYLYGDAPTFIIGVTPDLTGNGGKSVIINSGDAPADTTDAGGISLQAGSAAASSSNGGSISLQAGGGGSPGAGGDISLTAGDVSSFGTAGSISLTAGSGGALVTKGNITLDTASGGQVKVTNTDQSTSTTTGALRVYGGAGIGGSLYALNLYDSGNRVVTRVTPSGSTYIGVESIVSAGTATSFTIKNLGVTDLTGSTYLGISTSTGSISLTNLGVQTLTAGTDTAVSSSTGTVTVWNTSTLQSITQRGATTNQIISITNTTSAVSSTTGALQVVGGIGVQGDVFVGGKITAQQLTIEYTTITSVSTVIDDITTIKNATQTTSTNTGALQVWGGVGIGGGMFVGGTVTATNFVGNFSGVANTATNLAGGATNSIPYQANAGITSFIAIGSSGYFLQSNGPSVAPSWTALSGVTAGSATTATNLAGGTTGAIPYQSTTGTTTFIGIGNTGTLLQSNGTTATWANTATMSVGLAVTATNIANGQAGQLHYQTAPGVTAFISTGTIGNVAVSSGINGITYQNTLTLTGTTAATSTTTGALTVSGGVGVGGNLYAAQVFDDGNRVVTRITPNGSTYIGIDTITSVGTATAFTVKNLGVTNLSGSTYIGISTSTGSVSVTNLGVQTLTAGTDTVVTSSTGTVTVYNNSTLQTVTSRGATTNQAISITNATASTSTNTGALQVTGGVGIGGGLNVGGTITGTVTTATNLAGGATNSLPYQTNAGITSFIAIGSIGYILQSNGPSVAPSWTALSGVTAGSATTATNLAGGTPGALPYQSTTGTTAFISIGSTGTILQSNGTTATWVSTSTLTVASAITATNIASGQAGQLHYQTAPGVTGFISTGTIGNVAVSSGINGIAYQNTLTLTGTTVSASTTTGALTVAGGVGIGGALNVGGNILPGTTNQYDLGSPTNRFRTLYVSSATVDIGGVTLSNVSGVLTLPKTTINDTTTATSTNTGALTVTGGVGVGGSVYIGKALYGNSSTFTIGVTPDVSQGKAIVIASGDAPGSVTDAGDVTITAGAGASSSQAGSINLNAGSVSSGGAGSINLTAGNNALGSGGDIKLTPGIKGVSGNDGAVLINRYTAATSTTTGALQVYGGVGVGGSLYASNLYDSGNRVVTRVTPNGSTYIGIDTITSVGTATTFTVKNLGVQQNIGTTFIGVSTSTGSVYITNLGVQQNIGTTYIGVSASTGSVYITNLGVQTLTAGTDTAVTNNTGTVTVWNTSTLQTVTGRGATTNNAISITNTTAVISTLTGALTVAGGVGIGGGIFVGGTVTATLFVGNLTGTATNATNATTATNLAGGATNSLPYQSNTGTTAFIAIGSSGYILQSNGAGSAPSWASVGALSAGQATTATNLAGGTPGAIPYQVSTGTTDFIGIGASNTVLFSNGTTATWVSTASILGAVTVPVATPTILGTVFGYTTGLGNTAIGCCSGNITQTGCNNFAAGCTSLESNTTGCNNVAIGFGALKNTCGSGSNNFASGFCALYSNRTGSNNTAIGCLSLYNNRFGTSNISVGFASLFSSTTGCNNTALGFCALYSNISGSNNVAIGCSALFSNTGADNGIAIGACSQKSFFGTVGHNVAIGCGTLCANTTGWNNTAIGSGALQSQTYAIGNTAIGYGAMLSNITGDSNVAIGFNALSANTVGNYNTALGYNSLKANTTGFSHVAVGWGALLNQTGGNNNIALGFASANSSTTSCNNISLGMYSLNDNCTGNNNIGLGCQSLFKTVNASCNIGIGAGSLFTNTTGAGNIAIGYQSGCAITTGSYNVIIGTNTGSSIATSNCNIIISDGLGNARICATNTGSVLIPSTSNAISTQTGALQVTGGVGIGDALYVGSTASVYTSLYIGENTATTYIGGYTKWLVLDGVNKLTQTGMAGFELRGGSSGGLGVQSAINFAARGTSGSTVNSARIEVTNSASQTNVGIMRLYTRSTSALIEALRINDSQLVSVLSPEASVSTATGALQVVGGVGIGGSVWVGGELNIRGATTFQGNVTFAGSSTNIFSTNTVYTDNMLNLHVPSGSSGTNHTWTVDDGRDIGLLFHYYQGADRDAGLVLNNSSKYLEWYSNGIENPANGTFTSTTYGIFKTGGIILAGGTTSTSVSTGDLVITGGAGIGGDLWVGGTINANVTGVSTTATNIAGGTAGAIPYQSSAGVTSFIGIGSTGYVLTSNGSTATWVATAPGASVVDDTATNATYYPVFSTSTTGAFAQATISSSKLTWNPSTGQMTMVDINTTSDIAAKDNINQIEDPLEILKKIAGFSFNWRDTGAKSYGVIAQYIEQILPELVSEDSTGLKAVKYLPLIAILIESVKKLSTEIDEIRKAGK